MQTRPKARIVAALLALGLLVGTGQAAFHSSAAPGYTVRPGDSLWRISRHYHVTVAQLAAANNMIPSQILLIGRHLVIPTPGASAAARPAAAAPAAASGPSKPNPYAVDPNFCQVFTPQAGPRGVLPSVLRRSASRLALRPLFVTWAADYGISPALLEAVDWQESGWQETAVSSAGAVGIGQIMPGTGVFISNQLVGQALNAAVASDNIRLSAAFLGYLSRVQHGNTCLTLASYYEGPLNVEHRGVFFISEPYVASIEALMPRFE